MHCPCGSGREFERCCGPCLKGEAAAPTAEALMRSRYVAYVSADMDYLARTLAPESRAGFDARSARQWATQAEWLGLKILSTQAGGAADRTGVVAFAATYRQNGDVIEHREVSQFRRAENGEWLFVKGDVEARAVAPRASAPKVGRNDPCPCGSGKKYKKCCGV